MKSTLKKHLAKAAPVVAATRIGGTPDNAASMFLGELSAVFTPAAIDKLPRSVVEALFEDWLHNYAQVTRSQRFDALMAGMQIAPVTYTLYASGCLLSEPDRPEPRDNVVQLHARIR